MKVGSEAEKIPWLRARTQDLADRNRTWMSNPGWWQNRAG